MKNISDMMDLIEESKENLHKRIKELEESQESFIFTLTQTLGFLKSNPTETCMCGEKMDKCGSSVYTNHPPTSIFDYYIDLIIDDIENVLKKEY